jgi:hypothetical protein
MALFSKSEKTPTVNSSLLTAYTYLLQRLDRQFDANRLAQNLSDLEEGEDPYILLTLVDPQLKVIETGGFGTWPASNNSVLHFRINDEENPGSELDYYCVAADAGDHQVIDSDTGAIKNGNVFGQPLDWAIFGASAANDPIAKEKDPSRYYTVLKGGENAYQIGLKLGVSSSELIEHNGIEDPDLPEGTELHLPTALPPKDKPARTVIELLDYPTKMHVIKEGGTRKFAFGNAKNLESIGNTGPAYSENANLIMVALAHVPLKDGDKDVVAGYYMDQLAVGNFKKTGRVAWEIGFNHAHLAEGHVEKAVVAPAPPRPQIAQKLAQMEIEQQAAQDIAAIDEEEAERRDALAKKVADIEADQAAHPERYPNLWKASIKPLNEKRETVTYIANETMAIKELSGRRMEDKMFYKYKGVKLKYTVEKDGILYGLPESHDKTSLYWGFPMDLLTSEEELFNTNFDLPTRVYLNANLTLTERYVSVPLSRALNHKWLKSHVEKIKKF